MVGHPGIVRTLIRKHRIQRIKGNSLGSLDMVGFTCIAVGIISCTCNSHLTLRANVHCGYR